MTLEVEDVPILSESNVMTEFDSEIKIYADRNWCIGRLTGRGSLAEGDPVIGPALLEDPTCTLFVPQGWQAVRDLEDNTVVTRK